jgi:hypothetical protein
MFTWMHRTGKECALTRLPTSPHYILGRQSGGQVGDSARLAANSLGDTALDTDCWRLQGRGAIGSDEGIDPTPDPRQTAHSPRLAASANHPLHHR